MSRLRGDLCTHPAFFIHGRVMGILRQRNAPRVSSSRKWPICREFAETCQSWLASECGMGFSFECNEEYVKVMYDEMNPDALIICA